MRLDNVRFLRAEEFEPEMRNNISRIASIINPFMQEVFDLTDGRIDFENTVQSFRTVQITVNSSGNPVGTNQLNLGTDATQIKGLQVIRARNLTNQSIFPTGQPFISYTTVNQQLIQVNNITSLPAGRYELNIVIY